MLLNRSDHPAVARNLMLALAPSCATIGRRHFVHLQTLARRATARFQMPRNITKFSIHPEWVCTTTILSNRRPFHLSADRTRLSVALGHDRSRSPGSRRAASESTQSPRSPSRTITSPFGSTPIAWRRPLNQECASPRYGCVGRHQSGSIDFTNKIDPWPISSFVSTRRACRTRQSPKIFSIYFRKGMTNQLYTS